MIDDAGQPERPARGEDEPWRDYWARVQPREWFERWGFWRTEPEIDARRRAELTERRALTPDFEHGVYRFGGLALTRADVEWLLATHESADIRGPVDLSDERQLGRVGLDLRGADLRGQDLSRLPLARTRGGITPKGWLLASIQQREAAAAHFEDATFVEAWLEAVSLRGAHLERAYFRGAHLEGADLTVARLDGATLSGVYLGGTRIPFTARVLMDQRRVDKRRDVRRQRTRFLTLPSADLHGAFFDDATILIGPHVADDQGMGIRLADIRWGGANLARTDWRRLRTTGARSGRASRITQRVRPGVRSGAGTCASRPSAQTANWRRRCGPRA